LRAHKTVLLTNVQNKKFTEDVACIIHVVHILYNIIIYMHVDLCTFPGTYIHMSHTHNYD